MAPARKSNNVMVRAGLGDLRHAIRPADGGVLPKRRSRGRTIVAYMIEWHQTKRAPRGDIQVICSQTSLELFQLNDLESSRYGDEHRSALLE